MITKNTPSDTAISPKKGILVVSFGTSHPDTRAVTINAIEESIRNAHPDLAVYSAWTSQMIIRKLSRTTGEHIPPPSQRPWRTCDGTALPTSASSLPIS